MSFRDRIASCHRYDIRHFRPFLVSGEAVGWVTHTLAHRLTKFAGIFKVTTRAVALDATLVDVADRTAAVAEVMTILVREGYAPPLRQESFPVVRHFGGPEFLRLDRSAVPLFGVRAFGVHVNGIVYTPSGSKLWIGRRSRTKKVEPCKLDNLTAGGIPADISIMDNLIKECSEEANIPKTLSEKARPVGAISYCMENGQGLQSDCMFCFDLHLPAAFVPRNADGEMESFTLMPVPDVIEKVRTTEAFKLNVNLVILDFAIRHGFVTPAEPDYMDLLFLLRGPAQPLPGHPLFEAKATQVQQNL